MRGSLASRFRPDIKWISIEGTVAAGKSTLLRVVGGLLESTFGEGSVLTIQEPVDQWVASGHLEKSRAEPYVVQTHIVETRIQSYLDTLEALSDEEAQQVCYILTERSPHSDRYVFWDLVKENGITTPLMAPSYSSLWDTLARLVPFEKPHLFLYLTVDIEVAQVRMVKRKRECEQDTVSWEYQRQLIGKHESLFNSPQKEFMGTPCVSISSEEPYHEDKESQHVMASLLVDILSAIKGH